MNGITTCLWFDGQAEQAAEFYCSVFPDSKITSVTPYPEGSMSEPGSAMTVEFSVGDSRFVGLNGGPQFTFSEAVSFQVLCESQDEVDRYWDVLTADGGQESQCGWLKDRFGVSWQILPSEMFSLVGHPDPERAQRATQAMLQMRKIDLDVLRRAASG